MGAFFVLLALGLNSWTAYRDQRKKVNGATQKARDAKAAKAAAAKAAEEGETILTVEENGSNEEQDLDS